MTELLQSTLLRKTQLGLTSLKERDRALDQKSRTLLILIDGNKTVAELSKFSADPTQIPKILQTLLEAGLVSSGETGLEAKSSAEATLVAKAIPPPTQQANLVNVIEEPIDFKASVRKASRALENLLGPSSDVLCLQIEKCKTMAELVAKVQDLRAVVATLRSPKKADEFIAAALGS